MIANGRYYGKYEGVVVDNQDPLKLGRVKVRVKSVTGLHASTWARPCAAWGGFQKGIFAVPPRNTSVFVEYLDGDIDKPVWTGCYWETALESPSKGIAENPGDAITIQTQDQTSIQIVENKHIKLQCGLSTITIKPTAVEISAPEIKIESQTGKVTVSGLNTEIKASTEVKIEGMTNINNGNLRVMK